MSESWGPSPGADLGLEVHSMLSGSLKGYGEWRNLGLIVGRVRKDGPAARAAIQAGDILLQIDQNLLLSLDDLRDFLATSLPGAEATVFYFRAGNQQKVTVRLERPEDSADESTFPWDYAGLVQLTQALRYAKTGGKNTLVGLSGSDT